MSKTAKAENKKIRLGLNKGKNAKKALIKGPEFAILVLVTCWCGTVFLINHKVEHIKARVTSSSFTSRKEIDS